MSVFQLVYDLTSNGNHTKDVTLVCSRARAEAGRLLGSLKHWKSQQEGTVFSPKGRWRPGSGCHRKRSEHGEGVTGERLLAHTSSRQES